MDTGTLTPLMFEFGPDLDKLSAALVTFQGKVGPVAKTKTAKVQMKSGGSYTYDYADLADVIASTKEARAAAELAVVQMPVNSDRGITIITTILHSSGQWMRSSLTMFTGDSSPQAIGSLITYGRRYSYSAALGICTEADDDGNAAQGDPNKKWVAGPKGAAEGKAPAPNGNQGAPSATTPSPSRAVPANRIPHDGTFANPKQVQLIHVLKAKVGGLSDDLYRRQLAAFKDCDGKPITTSKDLSEAQAAHLASRYEAKIKEQEATAAKGIDLNALPASNVRDLTRKLAQERDIAAEDILSIFGVDNLEQLSEADAVNAYALVSAWGTEQFDRVRDSIQTRA